MSIFALTWAWELEEAPNGTRVTSTDKLVLLCLADHHNDQTGACFPGIARIMAVTRLTEKPIRNAIHRLEAMGLVSVSVHRGTSSKYILALPESVKRAAEGRKSHSHPDDPARKMSPVRRTGLWKRRQSPVPGPQSPVFAAQSPVPGTTITVLNREEAKEPPLPPGDGGSALAPSLFDNPNQGPLERLPRRSRTTTPALPKGDPLEGFDAFWANYPRRVTKGAARKAWPRAVRAAGGDWRVIVNGLRARLHLPELDVSREGGRYVKHPSVWLNGECWNDEVPGMDDDNAAAGGG